MSRRRTSGARGGGRGAGALPARRSSRRRGWLLLVLAGFAIAIVTLLVTRRRAPAPIADFAIPLDPQLAFARAESLVTVGRFAEAVPFYRQATHGAGAQIWIPHAGLAMALRNSSVRRSRFGVDIPLLRSSYERVSAAREALDEVRIAARLAHEAVEQSAIAKIEGQFLEDWGLAREALAVYQRAQSLDSTGECARRASALIAQLRSPVVAPSLPEGVGP